ncbi:hypothetical protein LSTR_LSTR004505 [Laodelphax striatellus]|uniref:Uncharacterized protein n=1 Tax=Laodelphax striatellus TaxID=195883 RepID=A0A482XH62_LAOST|nr:hypothetical protein LSTR_LSTR004505 [Laodelphax striatellus]
MDGLQVYEITAGFGRELVVGDVSPHAVEELSEGASVRLSLRDRCGGVCGACCRLRLDNPAGSLCPLRIAPSPDYDTCTLGSQLEDLLVSSSALISTADARV